MIIEDIVFFTVRFVFGSASIDLSPFRRLAACVVCNQCLLLICAFDHKNPRFFSAIKNKVILDHDKQMLCVADRWIVG